MLDLEHVREKANELKEKEAEWDNKREIRRQQQAEIDDTQKKLNLLNSELKTKQQLLKRFTDRSGNLFTQESMLQELTLTTEKLKTCESRLIELDHQRERFDTLQTEI
jgi:hypothetical protein